MASSLIHSMLRRHKQRPVITGKKHKVDPLDHETDHLMNNLGGPGTRHGKARAHKPNPFYGQRLRDR